MIPDSITGWSRGAAEVILAEISPDMTGFPPPDTWPPGRVGAPGQRESAGRRGSAKPRKGSPWLADVLTECAWAAVKTNGTYLSAYCRQVTRRQGKQNGIMALTHKILGCTRPLSIEARDTSEVVVVCPVSSLGGVNARGDVHHPLGHL
jgi:transposase